MTNRYQFAAIGQSAIVLDRRDSSIVSRNCPLSEARQIAERAIYMAAITASADKQGIAA